MGPEEPVLAGLGCCPGVLWGWWPLGLTVIELSIWLTKLCNNHCTRFNGAFLGFTGIGLWGVNCVVVRAKMSKIVGLPRGT